MCAEEDRVDLPWRETRDLAVQSFLAMVPYLGGIAQAWSGYTTTKRLLRVESFFEGLKKDMEALGRGVDLSDQQCEELPRLFEEVLDRVERETREEKIGWLRAFMAGAFLQGESWDLTRGLLLLQLLDRLGEAELFLVTLLAREDTIYLDTRSGQNARLLAAEIVWTPRNQYAYFAAERREWRLPIAAEWARLHVHNLGTSGIATVWNDGFFPDEGAARAQDDLFDNARGNYKEAEAHAERMRVQAVCCRRTAIAREFIDHFAFPGGKPVFGAPWDGVDKATT